MITDYTDKCLFKHIFHVEIKLSEYRRFTQSQLSLKILIVYYVILCLAYVYNAAQYFRTTTKHHELPINKIQVSGLKFLLVLLILVLVLSFTIIISIIINHFYVVKYKYLVTLRTTVQDLMLLFCSLYVGFLLLLKVYIGDCEKLHQIDKYGISFILIYKP